MMSKSLKRNPLGLISLALGLQLVGCGSPQDARGLAAAAPDPASAVQPMSPPAAAPRLSTMLSPRLRLALRKPAQREGTLLGRRLMTLVARGASAAAKPVADPAVPMLGASGPERGVATPPGAATLPGALAPSGAATPSGAAEPPPALPPAAAPSAQGPASPPIGQTDGATGSSDPAAAQAPSDPLAASSAPPTEDGPAAVLPPELSPTPNRLAQVIDGQGGVVRADAYADSILSRASVAIPPAALSAPALVSVSASAVALPKGRDGRAFGPAIEFGPDGQTFFTPVEIALPFDPALLASAGVKASDLRVLYFNPARGLWEEVPGSTVDEAAGVVRAPTAHFSHYVAGLPPGPPFIASLTPAAAVPGTTVRLSGGNFELLATSNAVTVGGRPAAVVGADGQEGTYLDVVIPSLIASGPVDVTVTTSQGSSTAAGAFNNLGSRAYVLNANSNDVSVVDTVTRRVMATLPAGNDPTNGFPHDLKIRSDGTEAYVVNLGEATVSVLDALSLDAAATVTISLPTPNYPALAALSPDEKWLAVGLDRSVALINVDPAAPAGTRYTVVRTTADLGGDVIFFAFSPDGSRLYVPATGHDNRLWVFDMTTSPVGAYLTDLALDPGRASGLAVSSTRALIPNGQNTISVVGTDPSDPTTYHQLQAPLTTTDPLAMLAHDPRRGQTLCLFTGANNNAIVRALSDATRDWLSGMLDINFDLFYFNLDPASDRLFLISNDYDATSSETVFVVSTDPASGNHLQALAALTNVGRSVYDVGPAPNQSLLVVANGDNDTITLADYNGSDQTVLPGGSAPWVVGVVREP